MDRLSCVPYVFDSLIFLLLTGQTVQLFFIYGCELYSPNISFAQILLTHGGTTVDSSKRIYMVWQQLFSPWCEVSDPSTLAVPPNLPPSSPPAGHPRWSRDWCRQQLVHEGDVGDCQAKGFNSRESLLVGKSGNLKTYDKNKFSKELAILVVNI